MFPTTLTRGRRTTTATAGALVLLALLAGCGDDGSSAQDPADTADTPSATESTATTETETPTPTETSTEEPTDEPTTGEDVLVTVIEPADGSTVPDVFTARGKANSFEATVPWQIRKGDEVVLDGFATAEGWMDKLYPWETEVDASGLEPGEYTFVAMTDDPSGGTEGPGPQEAAVTIVIE